MLAVGDRVYVIFAGDKRTRLLRELPPGYDPASVEFSDESEACAATVICVNPLPNDHAISAAHNDHVNFHRDSSAFAKIAESIAMDAVIWRERCAASQAVYCVHLDDWVECDHSEAMYTNVAFCPTHASTCALCPTHGTPRSAWLFQCIFTLPM